MTVCVLAGCEGDEPARSGASESNPASLPIRVMLFQGQEVRVNCLDRGYTIRAARDERVVLRCEAGQACSITRRNGQWVLEKRISRRFEPAGQIHGDALDITPEPGGSLTLGESSKRAYRGTFRLHRLGEDRFAVVNVLDIEAYLKAVVPGEMFSHWDQAALQAQAIASRTYALFEKLHAPGHRRWDLTGDQRSQVYQGIHGESKRTSKAVRQTRGIVVAYGAANEEKIFPTFFSAICGGHTEDATAVIGRSIRPLHGHRCDYCEEASKSHFSWKPVTLSKQLVSERLTGRYAQLDELKEIRDIKALNESPYGRVVTLQLVGRNGETRTLLAESVRLALSRKEAPIRSNWYRLIDAESHWRFEQGRGWGHGVGLCQYGSRGMAQAGYDCVAILKYYYPEAVLVRAY